MSFNSIPYIILFPLIVLLYRLIPEKLRYVWLLVVSCAFYYAMSRGFIVLLAVSVVITYVTGIAVEYLDLPAAKKAVMILAVVLNLGILFLFKYLDFTLGLFGSPLRFDLMLPLGISFYTFQAVSYIADVYRGKIQSEKNILKLALYISFFLSIVSGPINRAGDILPQLSGNADISYEKTKTGMQKMLWGYFLKLAIAGRLAIIVENVYGNTDAYSGAAVAFTALAYMFMLYCDFEGYSQIAIGSGYLLGITMKENFRQPFYADSMSEIWRRWHISLSTWFRDYLYIPLGGSRRGTVRKYINLFVVLFISGIWHGANLTFFIWGALNGIYIVVGQILLPYRDKLADKIKGSICSSDRAEAGFDSVRLFFKRLGVYILFSYIFMFFANDSVKSAWLAVKAVLTRFFAGGFITELTTLGLGRFNLAVVLAMTVFVFIADGAANRRNTDTPSLAKIIPTPLRWVLYWALLTAILFSANLTGKEFIYSMM